ncbi:anti-sigma-K factor rskA [Rhodococcus sp. OK519]|uniref:anti-sigma factor n=1 Tax=Rhodococcus sp. OK519 TaxID=2135729 RepID=UPI000D350CF7|nr:anti-sigma-K factor rskA [Rhodococcus sp. OK519]
MDDDLIEWAHAYALHALDDDERHALDSKLADADDDTRAQFDTAVRLARETMAAASSLVAVTPPSSLRRDLLRQVSGDELAQRRNGKRRWQIAMTSVAAAIVILVGGVVIGRQVTEAPPAPSVTAQILDSPDMQSSSTAIPGGGTATAMYSKDTNAAMLVMNGVAPPQPDTVYQMWLVRGSEPVPAGTMAPDQVAPTTTAVLEGLDGATKLGFTVEPPGGSTYPTGTMFAAIPLT